MSKKNQQNEENRDEQNETPPLHKLDIKVWIRYNCLSKNM
jgi:hypothetical protein